MDAEKLKGMAVVSVAQGTRVGRITDVLFDTQQRCVAGLRLEHEGQTLVVPLQSLRHIGRDAVTVEDTRAALAPAASATLGDTPSLEKIVGLKVVDADGKYLGHVQLVEIDENTGRVTRVEVHRGGVLGIGGTTDRIEAEFVRSMGPEVLTVAAERERHPAVHGQSPSSR